MSKTIARVLGDGTVKKFREEIHGSVLRRGDNGYDAACGIGNGEFDGRRPAVIITASGAADVITAVGFSRSNDLPIAVRGGGHSIARFSNCDDGLMLHLSAMNSVRIDPSSRRAHFGPGAAWADVD